MGKIMLSILIAALVAQVFARPQEMDADAFLGAFEEFEEALGIAKNAVAEVEPPGETVEEFKEPLKNLNQDLKESGVVPKNNPLGQYIDKIQVKNN